MKKKELIFAIIIFCIFIAITIATTILMFIVDDTFVFVDLLLFNIYMYITWTLFIVGIFNPNPIFANILFRFVLPILSMILLLTFAILNIFEEAWFGMIIDIIMLGFTGYYFWKRVKHIVR